MLLHIRQIDYHQQEMIPCQIYKVTTGNYVNTPTPPYIVILSQIRKNIGNNLFLFSHICYYIHLSENGFTAKKDTLPNLRHHPPPHEGSNTLNGKYL